MRFNWRGLGLRLAVASLCVLGLTACGDDDDDDGGGGGGLLGGGGDACTRGCNAAYQKGCGVDANQDGQPEDRAGCADFCRNNNAGAAFECYGRDADPQQCGQVLAACAQQFPPGSGDNGNNPPPGGDDCARICQHWAQCGLSVGVSTEEGNQFFCSAAECTNACRQAATAEEVRCLAGVVPSCDGNAYTPCFASGEFLIPSAQCGGGGGSG